jgi:predicted enzyme related to lactoylglutathione lyase
MSNPVIHFEIQADDVERAKNFYEHVFGWKVDKMMSADQGGMDYWGLKTRDDGTPGINGGMYKRGDEKFYTYDCTVQVADIDKAIADVKANGGKIRPMPNGKEKDMIPGVGWFAGATDTEGNRVGLMQATEWQAK